MRIVHSFWSKPMLDETGKSITNLTYSSWVNKFMFYHTYVLSSLLINQHYPGKTTLVTDEFGKKLLIDTLGLAYDDVRVILDDLNPYPKQFWALGKLYTYSLFSEPFIHLDFDFLLAKPFESAFLTADLVAYMDENDESRQKPYLKCVNDYFLTYRVPGAVGQFFSDYQYIAYNAGVFGGQIVSIFQDLWQITKTIIDENREQISRDARLDPSSFYMTNVIFEQYVFACLARQRKLSVACLHGNENLLPDESDLWQATSNLPKYKVHYFPHQHVHMVGHNKNSIDNARLIQHHLHRLSPGRLQWVNELIRSGAI